MNYEQFSDAGTLHVEYHGQPLDALALGTLELQLHKIAEKVAIQTLLEDRRGIFALLDRPGFVSDYSWRRMRKRWPKMMAPYFADIFPPSYSALEESLRDIPIVRLRTDSLRSGSIYQDLTLYVAEVIANPDTRAVLQGFGGNLLYSIYESGLRGIEFIRSPNEPREKPSSYDPYDVGDNLRKIAAELIANCDGETSTVTIKHKIKDGESEVQIRVR